MSRRRFATVAVATLATASIALPAFAHASFDKTQVPADTEVDLTFRAPQERASTNARIEALAPRQFTILECTAPTNWTCEIDTTSQAPASVVRWVAGSSAVLPEMNFEMFVRTPGEDQQGVYAWPVIQTYADGFEAEWIGDDAPRIQVGDKDAEVMENPEPENNHSEPQPASEPAGQDPEPSSSSASSASRADESPEPSPATESTDAPTAQGTPVSVTAGSDQDAQDAAASSTTATDDGDAEDAPAAAAAATEPADEDGGAPLGLALGILAVVGLAGGALVLRNRAAG